MFEDFPLLLICSLMTGPVDRPVQGCKFVSRIDKVTVYECTVGHGSRCGTPDYREGLRAEVEDWEGRNRPEQEEVWHFQKEREPNINFPDLTSDYTPLGRAPLGSRLP